MDKVTAVVEILKAVSWPMVVLILGYVFRKPIQDVVQSLREMAPRVNEIGLNGVKMTPATAQETPAASASSEVLAPSPIMQADVPDFLLPYIENIHIFTKEQNIKPDEMEKFLIRQSAAKDVFLDFWRAYNVIFGSQIAFMTVLNSVTSLTDEQCRAHFQSAVQSNPGFYENYKYEQWLEFLIARRFVRVDKGDVSLTEFGRRFLEFLITARLPTNRIG